MLRCWADGADGRQTYSSLHRCCCYFCRCASPPAAGLAAICPLARLQPSQQPHQPPHLPSAPPRCSSTSRWPPRPSPFGSSRWCQQWASSTSAPCLHTLAGALDGWQRCIAVLQEPGIAASALACPHGTRPGNDQLSRSLAPTSTIASQHAPALLPLAAWRTTSMPLSRGRAGRHPCLSGSCWA